MALSAERIVEAACGILDDYGLGDLTMRRVAEALGVKAGALYWHFPNKQSLLAGVADKVLSPLERPVVDADGTWLGEWAGNVRALLLAHRDAAELVSSTRAMGLGRVDPASRARQALSDMGASEDEADGVAQAFLHFVLGHVMEEQTQSQLAELGVIKAFDSERSERHFERGVLLLVSGVQQGTRHKVCSFE